MVVIDGTSILRAEQLMGNYIRCSVCSGYAGCMPDQTAIKKLQARAQQKER